LSSLRSRKPLQAGRHQQSFQQSIGDESFRHRCASAPCSSVWFLWSLWFFWLVFRSGQQDRPNRPDKRDEPVSALRSRRTRSRIPSAPEIPTAPAVPRISTAAACGLKGDRFGCRRKDVVGHDVPPREFSFQKLSCISKQLSVCQFQTVSTEEFTPFYCAIEMPGGGELFCHFKDSTALRDSPVFSPNAIYPVLVVAN